MGYYKIEILQHKILQIQQNFKKRKMFFEMIIKNIYISYWVYRIFNKYYLEILQNF